MQRMKREEIAQLAADARANLETIKRCKQAIIDEKAALKRARASGDNVQAEAIRAEIARLEAEIRAAENAMRQRKQEAVTRQRTWDRPETKQLETR